LDNSMTALTDDTGRFRFADVLEGAHEVGLSTTELPAQFDPGDPKEVKVVVQPRRTARAGLSVMPLTAIEGSVAGPDAAALDGIVIRLLPGSRYTTADSEGAFSFHNLREGDYQVALDEDSLPDGAALTTPRQLAAAPRRAQPVTLPEFRFEIHVQEKPVRKVDVHGRAFCAAGAGSARRPAAQPARGPAWRRPTRESAGCRAAGRVRRAGGRVPQPRKRRASPRHNGTALRDGPADPPGRPVARRRGRGIHLARGERSGGDNKKGRRRPGHGFRGQAGTLMPLRSTAVVLVFAAASAAAQSRPVKPAPTPLAGNPAPFTSTSNLKATPATITFTSTDPDAGAVSGSSTATVTWTVTGGATSRTWTLAVNASAASLTNCGEVPASAIKVTCATASVSGGAGTGACAAAFNLSNALQTVASGKEGNGTRGNTVTITYQFTDEWSYKAHVSPLCAATVTYTATDP
jgi:hypothetical protein